MRRTSLKMFRWVEKLSRPNHILVNSVKGRRFCSAGDITNSTYGVIVVGGGHAGTEASHAAARMGVKTLLVTHKKDTIGVMSCNPSFGGIGKGHLIREIDALDGVCARICDKSGIAYRVLNRCKGPSVWGLRAQIDRSLYHKYIQEEMFHTPNLTIVTGSVEDLILDEETDNVKCCGIVLADGTCYHSHCVVLTTGTFLRAYINVGLETRPAGRLGDESSIGLADTLQRLKFNIGTLRTGTPPRLQRDSINFENLKSVAPDNPSIPFSFLNRDVWIKPEHQLHVCFTRTNKTVENICLSSLELKVNKHVREEVKSPRYCPSIETKSVRFAGKQHIVWLEPEGLDSPVIYPGGLSCTMPAEMQDRMIHAIPGLENAIILQHGYGVDYEFVDPRELTPALETKKISSLFFAGQINGTTGYEEAAAQGILAGINAAAKVQQKPEFLINRTDGYIGVLVDDLTTLGADEPYRMFTARSELRLFLRPDNADMRLTKRGYEIGCVSDKRYEYFTRIKDELLESLEILQSNEMSLHKWRKGLGLHTHNCHGRNNALNLFRMDDRITVDLLEEAFPDRFKGISKDPVIRNRCKIEGTYTELQERQRRVVNEMRRDEKIKIPARINYKAENIGLRFEEVEKLTAVQPSTLGAASRIPGITPAGILRLLYYIKVHYNQNGTPLSH